MDAEQLKGESLPTCSDMATEVSEETQQPLTSSMLGVENMNDVNTSQEYAPNKRPRFEYVE